MHHPVAWYCFNIGLFLLFAWVVADCIHVVKNPARMSVLRLVFNWIMMMWGIALLLIMVAYGVIAFMRGML